MRKTPQTRLKKLTQLERNAHVTGHLKLAHGKGRHRVQLALHKLGKVCVRDSDGAISGIM